MRALAALPLVLIASPALAASGSATGTARTLQPIRVVATRDLDFGTLIVGATAGTATVNARTDARTRTGGVTLASGAAAGAARFAVNGTPRTPAQITLGARPTLIRSGGSETMRITALRLNGGRNRTFNAAGSLDVRVGATLAVAANQMAGLYAATFTVTVEYR